MSLKKRTPPSTTCFRQQAGRCRRPRRDRGFLDGEEASFIVMVDGKNVLALASSQDHKRIFDGDQGPNTGGMGAYSPAPCVTPEVHAKAMREIILPTVRGMAADGIPFTGFLYAGLMIGKDGSVKTLEFNCRMGDPETQPILMRLKSDFVDPAGARHRRHARPGRGRMGPPHRARRRAGCRQLPGHPQKGDVIGGLPKGNSFGDDCHVFHAGTANEGQQGRHQRRPRVLRHRPRRKRQAGPEARSTRLSPRLAGTACSSARTLVTAPSIAEPFPPSRFARWAAHFADEPPVSHSPREDGHHPPQGLFHRPAKPQCQANWKPSTVRAFRTDAWDRRKAAAASRG